MYLIVPGGQQVYVTPTGPILYTQAHSATMYPQNSTLTGWTLVAPVTRGFGQLSWTGATTGHGFTACPSSDSDGAWQLGVLPTDDTVLDPGCEEIDLLVPMITDTGDFGVDGVGAWQYT
jgi:hypothetical protein